VVKDGGTIEVKVKSTVDYDVEIKDSWISSTDTKALAESTHSFVVAANSEVQGRNGYIVFKSKTTEHKDTVTVNQSGAGGYRWYNGIEASTFVPGSGTENDPYIIHTANDLQWLIDQANYGDEDIHEQNDYDYEKTFKTMGKHYRLTHDIEIDSDYDVVDGSGNVIQAKGWTPIGMGLGDSYRYEVFKAFNGHFDGGGHTISGKMVPVSQLTEEGNLYFGLFGHCWMPKGDGNVTIKNLNMTAVVDAQHALSPTNSAYIGSIVGYGQELEIDSCTNSGNVTGGDFTVDNMQYLYLGGLVGYFEGKGEVFISDCENKGEIRGGKVSPLLGYSHVGGLVGYGNYINAKGLTNRGKVYGAGYETAFTGGIFGYCHVQKSASELNNHSQVYGPEINVLEYNDYGSSKVGGIAGDIYGRDDTKLTDVNNHADITGGIFTGNYFDKNELYIGGIGGVCSVGEVGNASNTGKILACPEYDTIIKEASVGGLFGYLTSGVVDSTNEGEVHIDFVKGTIFAGG
ncbi:MAG: BACON domain-containing protein, partial [Bacteroidales bacterium]|nr:BACON domain-containing protein [Bacteroidales bacterium]